MTINIVVLLFVAFLYGFVFSCGIAVGKFIQDRKVSLHLASLINKNKEIRIENLNHVGELEKCESKKEEGNPDLDAWKEIGKSEDVYYTEYKDVYFLEYEGYIARVNFDSSISKFYGTVVNIPGVINFYGSNKKEAMEEFKISIKDYVAFCAKYSVGSGISMEGDEEE